MVRVVVQIGVDAGELVLLEDEGHGLFPVLMVG
jgi:hypothetical protein